MRLFLILFLFICCSPKKKVQDQINEIIALLHNEDIAKADSIFKGIDYCEECGFDYRVVEIVLEFKKNNFKNCQLHSLKFIEKYPKSPLGFYYSGLCYFNLLNYTESEKSFSQSYDKIKGGARGFVYKEKKKGIGIDELYIYDDLVFMIGASKRMCGKYQSAIPFLESCINIGYRKADAFFILGECYDGLGDKVNSTQYYLLAKKFGNTDADAALKK